MHTAGMAHAQGFCRRRLGAHLVDILSLEENRFVRTFASKTLRRGSIWLGIQRESGKEFKNWLTGASVHQYQDWTGGELSNVRKDASCAIMNIRAYARGWQMVPCDTQPKPAFVCKKPKP